MSHNILYVFAISHYCEKARWALDHFGIDYQLRFTMPGTNRSIAKKLGAASGSLPFLKTAADTIAGSNAIIDWGEINRAPHRASLSGDDPNTVRAFEKRLDDVTGVHVRCYYYSDALINDPASVRPIFSRDLALLPKLGVTLAWTKIVQFMIKGMDLGPAQGLASRDIILAELDWLDNLLADGRPYLTGEHFTRADLTAASLLAPLVNPAKHPTYSDLALPSALAATIAHWQNRPALKWVLQIYDKHR
jgi:glutathione S-transferase